MLCINQLFSEKCLKSSTSVLGDRYKEVTKIRLVLSLIFNCYAFNIPIITNFQVKMSNFLTYIITPSHLYFLYYIQCHILAAKTMKYLSILITKIKKY